MDGSDEKYDREEGQMSDHPIVRSQALNAKSLRLVNLPDNKIAVVNNPASISEKLKDAGGKYNRTTTPIRGYIFSADKMETVNKILSEASTSHTGALAGESSNGGSEMPKDVNASAAQNVTTNGDKVEGLKESSVSEIEGAASATDAHSAQAESSGVAAGSAQTTTASEAKQSSSTSGSTAALAESMPAETTTGTAMDTTSDIPAAAAASSAPPTTSAEPVATDKAPFIVQLSTRTIALLGTISEAFGNELTKIGGKFNKSLQFGESKAAGWTFPKKHLEDVQKVIPGVPFVTEHKSHTVGGASGSSGEASPVEGNPTSPNKRRRLDKATESKPTESKPTESKPTESKPTESKPTESKPTESKATPAAEAQHSVVADA